jgi:hypothetical protein
MNPAPRVNRIFLTSALSQTPAVVVAADASEFKIIFKWLRPRHPGPLRTKLLTGFYEDAYALCRECIKRGVDFRLTPGSLL